MFLRSGGSSADEELDQPVCYKEGFGVKEMFQMCDVTSAFPVDGYELFEPLLTTV